QAKEEQRQAAEAARREAEHQRQLTQEALKQAKTFLYLNHIALAHNAWRDNAVARAEQLLADCPVAPRNWERHYLKHLCHTDLLTISCGSAHLSDVAFSPDGKALASTVQGVVKVWDAATGEQLFSLSSPPGTGAVSVAFSPDGTRLATAGSSPMILW